MREIEYKRLPGVGGGFAPARGTIVDLLEDIPYLFTFGLIPSLAVMNDLLRTGTSDAGMSGGCAWEPFQIARAEWEEIARALQSRPGPKREFVEPPNWVVTFSDWHIWELEYRAGVPAAAHKKLADEEAKWREQARAAGEAGNESAMYECHLKAVEAGTKLAELLTPYLQEYRRRPR